MYRDDTSTLRARAARSRRDAPRIDACELRARAVRYRRLAESLYDPRVIAEIQACACELEAEAALIEKQASAGVVLQ